MKNILSQLLLAFLAVLALCACHGDEAVKPAEDVGDNAFTVTRRIAIFATPESRTYYESVVGLALATINEAQSGCQEQLKLSVEWYNAASSTYLDDVKTVVADEDVPIIIGPNSSILSARLADAMAVYRDSHEQSEKMLILPTCTSAQLQRIYCDREFLWCLTGCDIMQSSLLLRIANTILNKPAVTLITTDDIYGKTFHDWCPFQATEYGIDMFQAFQLSEKPAREEVETIMREIAERNIQRNEGIPGFYSIPDAVLIASTDPMVYQVCDSMATEMFALEQLVVPFAADAGYTEQLIAHYSITKGLHPSADPESIFGDEYYDKDEHSPEPGEAQMYDAIIMSFLSLYHAYILEQSGTHKRLYDAMCNIVDDDDYDETYTDWNKEDMRVMVEMLGRGENAIKLVGCSSPLLFADKLHTTLLDSYYTMWTASEGKAYQLRTLRYQDEATNELLVPWDPSKDVIDPDANLNDDDDRFDYGFPPNKYAVIVAASSGWENYRHQADALAVYRHLMEVNFPPEQVILICEDDLAYDPRNPYPGNVHHLVADTTNLRNNIEVDYHPSQLTDEDMCSILCGHASDSLPQVLTSGPDDYVFVFWCGHGTKQNGFNWMDRHVSGSVVNHWLKQMKQEQKFRRLLFVAETCYSGGVGAQCSDIPGVMMLTSTNENEPSFADISEFDLQLQTYLSNGFGSTFIDTMGRLSSYWLLDVYMRLVQGTQGSHVSLYGVEGFGSLTRLQLIDFVGDPN